PQRRSSDLRCATVGSDRVFPTTVMARRGRDYRLDVVRGLCLWVMFADHLWDTARASGALSSRFFIPTFRDIGLVTAMELFVFLSGYVFGLVYSNILDAKGYRACQARALRRAREIYVWNLVALAAVVGIAGLMPLPPQLGEVTRLTALLADPAR